MRNRRGNRHAHPRAFRRAAGIFSRRHDILRTHRIDGHRNPLGRSPLRRELAAVPRADRPGRLDRDRAASQVVGDRERRLEDANRRRELVLAHRLGRSRLCHHRLEQGDLLPCHVPRPQDRQDPLGQGGLSAGHQAQGAPQHRRDGHALHRRPARLRRLLRRQHRRARLRRQRRLDQPRRAVLQPPRDGCLAHPLRGPADPPRRTHRPPT